MHKVSIVVALLLILFGCSAPEEKKNDTFSELTSLVDQYAENTLKKGNVSSLAIAVYQGGEAYQHYYGEIDSSLNNPPDNNILYEIASISKVFVGSLAARAVLEKKITLDDDIRKYLDGDYENLEFAGKPVTIRNLLTHTLGFETPPRLDSVYADTRRGIYENKAFDYDRSDFLEELKIVELDHSPGTFYDYNNVGAEIVAYILEKVYDVPYADLLRTFLDDLGMRNSYLQNYSQHESLLAKGYDDDRERAAIHKNPLPGGAFGIVSTLPDLTKFMKFQLESNASFIKESTRTLYKNEDEEAGYFWDVGTAEKEGFYYYKTGTSIGTQSGILICPDTQYGQILIMNNSSDAGLNDWISLYNRIEYDLIRYPKINLWSSLESDFTDHPEVVIKKYKELKKDTAKYFSTSDYLNNIGYSYLYDEKNEEAIKIFQLAISEDPENANLYDSLGEAFFKAGQYQKSQNNFEKSLALNPENINAETYITAIEKLLYE
ncbi:serine hydrolase [Lewinellaceae bacterium SD302]|nr:serine hydrolase [Lewinellaceae bacterium SD302]